MNTKQYYRGKYSLYYWCEKLGCSSYQFDILKRLLRSKAPLSDVQKTIDLIDIVIEEEGTQDLILTATVIDDFADDWELSSNEEALVRMVVFGQYRELRKTLVNSLKDLGMQLDEMYKELFRRYGSKKLLQITKEHKKRLPKLKGRQFYMYNAVVDVCTAAVMLFETDEDLLNAARALSTTFEDDSVDEYMALEYLLFEYKQKDNDNETPF